MWNCYKNALIYDSQRETLQTNQISRVSMHVTIGIAKSPATFNTGVFKMEKNYPINKGSNRTEQMLTFRKRTLILTIRGQLLP